MIEAPDHGHETTSEAYSFYVWLEAMYGRDTGDWTRFNAAWTNLETFIIPSPATSPVSYNADRPGRLRAGVQPAQWYPSPLDASIDAGQDPLYQRAGQSTYGNASIYGMHWLLDVDNVYGYGQAVSSDARTAATARSGSSTSTPTSVARRSRSGRPSPHPSCETFAFGQRQRPSCRCSSRTRRTPSSGATPTLPTPTPAPSRRPTGRTTWATERGQVAGPWPTVAKAAKMGDYLRYAFYDKYFKQPNCTRRPAPRAPARTARPTCSPGTTRGAARWTAPGRGGSVPATTTAVTRTRSRRGRCRRPVRRRSVRSRRRRPPTGPPASPGRSTSSPGCSRPRAPSPVARRTAGTARTRLRRPNLPKFYGMAYDVAPGLPRPAVEPVVRLPGVGHEPGGRVLPRHR